MKRPTLSIVDSVFKGITHSQARKALVSEFEKRKKTHCQIIEHMSHAGVPDLDACINSVVWNIEIKVRNDVLSDIQRLWITGRLLAGGRCAVVHYKTNGIMVLDLTQESGSHLFRQDMTSIKDVVNYFMARSEELSD